MSVMTTTTYPATTADHEVGSGSASSPRYPWRFWSTLGWAVVANAALLGVQYILRYADSHASLPFDRTLLGPITTILSMLAATLVLALAAHWRGPSARAYLGLVWPRWHHFLIALGAFAALYVGLLGLEYILPPTVNTFPESINAYRALLDHPAQLGLYWLLAVVTAPTFEEVIFRGFLLRGWSESRIGFVAALLLSTLLFVQGHTQYDLRGMLDVLLIGLTLGLTRWWSGSTLLTIMMHAGWNFTNNFIIALMAWTNG
jgi:membrane protease YdiL (CAAX protease family)